MGRSELSDAVTTVGARPSLLAVGAVSMAAWWATALALGAADPVVETVAGLVAIASGSARQGFLGPSAPKATLDVVRAVLFVGLAVVLLEVLWLALVLPARAATARALAREESLSTAARSLVGQSGHLLAAGLVHRTLVVAAFPLVAAAAVAVYFSLGTALEATAYAVGLHPHWVVAPLAVLFALAVGRRGATAVAGSPVIGLASGNREGSGLRVARAAPRRALSTPRRTARTGALVGTLVLLPLAVAVAGTLALERLSGSDMGGLTGFLAFVVLVTVPGVVGHALAVVVDVRATAADDADGESGNPPGIRAAVPWRRVALAALVLTGAGVAGGAVRVADHRPVSAEGPVPGPVAETADPDRVVNEGTAAVPRASHTVTSRTESRTLYANGTVEDWSPGIALRIRFDRPDEQVLVTARLRPPEEEQIYVTYVDGTVFVTGRVGTADLDPDREAMRRADLVAMPIHPGVLDGGRPQLAGTLGGTDADDTGGWTVLDRSDGRIRLESRDPETVSAFTEGSGDPDALVEGSVRATVSAETGRIRRVEVHYVRNRSTADHATEVRTTIVVEGYGTTEVSRPPGTDRGVVELVLDAVFY